jgi:hypothetical protein
MSFGSNDNAAPTPERKLLGLAPGQTASNEQGRPVPYLAGTCKVGVTYISDAFAQKSKAIRSDAKKEGAVTGYKYYASFAVAICCGIVERLDYILFDDAIVWEGPLWRDEDEDYADLTIVSRGSVRIYWGTETQTADPTLATSGIDHPGYRGVCYMVFDQLLLGEYRPAAPSIAVVVQRHPHPSWLLGSSDIQGDANPIAVLSDVMTDVRFGCGIGADRLDIDVLAAISEQLDDAGLGISVILDKPSGLREIIQEILEYFDGYITISEEGLIGVAIPTEADGTEPTLTAADLSEEPEVSLGAWADTRDSVSVVFTNRAKGYLQDSTTYRNRASHEWYGGPRSQTLQRPWATRQTVADRIAAVAGQIAGQPAAEASLRVRRGAAASLTPGSLIRLDYPLSGIDDMLMRVTEMRGLEPGSPVATVSVKEDHGHLFTDPVVPEEDELLPDPITEVSHLEYADIVEAPYALAGTEDPTLVYLPARPDALGGPCNVWHKVGPSSYDQVSTVLVPARRGHLLAEYPSATRLIDDEIGIEIQLDGIDTTIDEYGEESAFLGPLLIFAGDEILAGFEPELLGDGHYRLWTVRDRYGTVRSTHADDSEVFLVDLADLTKQTWPPTPLNRTFKLQPTIMGLRLPLGSCAEIDVTIDRRGFAPMRPRNLRVFDDGYNPFYTTGQDIEVDWDVSDKRRPLVPPTLTLVPEIDHTILEVWSLGGNLQETFTFDGASGPQTIDNADLVAALGSETSFVLRAYAERSGVRSGYESMTVLKV